MKPYNQLDTVLFKPDLLTHVEHVVLRKTQGYKLLFSETTDHCSI